METHGEIRVSKFKRVCVFCGSSPGKREAIKMLPLSLAMNWYIYNSIMLLCFSCPYLVSRNIDLVYGGGSIGLMGLVSQAVHDGGRHVIGVIPKTLMPREALAVTYLCMFGFEVLRGYGTLEELLEVITWAQLGIHDKPVGLVNVDGYFNSLLSFIDKAVEEGFISPNARHIIVSAPTSKELVKKLEDYVPCHESVASKLSWQMEQQLTYPEEYDISSFWAPQLPSKCDIAMCYRGLCGVQSSNYARGHLLVGLRWHGQEGTKGNTASTKNTIATHIHPRAKSENRKKRGEREVTVCYAVLVLANIHISGPLTCGAPFKYYFHVRIVLDHCYCVMDKEVIHIKGLCYLHASPYAETKKLFEPANAIF
ncbi:hypothetical protein ACSQ67_014679 [Phaseolus vulgaris]